MTEDIQLDPAITSGEDIGKGRRGIDWDRVERTLKFEHDTKTQASRQRGRATFNQLISQGVPYAEALRQAGDSGLFEEDSAGWQRMQQHVADMKQKEAMGGRDFHEPGVGVIRMNRETGKYENVFPFAQKAPKGTPSQNSALIKSYENTLKTSTDDDAKKRATASLESLRSVMGDSIPGYGIETNVTPAAPSGHWYSKDTPAQTNYSPVKVSAPAMQPPQSPISAPATEKVKVRKGGKSFMLPKSQLDEALKQGYEVGQ